MQDLSSLQAQQCQVTELFYGAVRLMKFLVSLWEQMSRILTIDNRYGLDPETFGEGDIEYGLRSGDEVDVMFLKGSVFRPVEVKSCRSVDVDIERGLYQCVKYRAVTAAEYLPYTADVEVYLVTQRELTSDEKEKARLLNIKTYCITQEKMRNWKSKQLMDVET